MTPSEQTTQFMLRSERLGLGPIESRLIDTYWKWFNDLAVTRTLAQPRRPVTREAEQRWFEGLFASEDAIFTIYEVDTMRPIGNTGLHEIDHRNGSCVFGIVIGERDAWNRGYGTETTRLMLAYAFDVLGLYSVRLAVYANNPWAIRSYERAGFKHAGRIRGAQKLGRVRVDELIMDALADEFEPSHLHVIMHPGGEAPQ